MQVSRRTFLAAAGLGLAAPSVFAEERPMPMRDLGRTGVKVSLAGLGTAQWGGRVSDAAGKDILHRAIDLGINYIDTAFSYARGDAERKLGLALRDGMRDKVFLTTKTLPRGKKGALAELETSLKRLGTDRVDLWQFHALTTTRDTDAILAAEGALEAGLAAKKAGKVRHLGITGHADPAVFVDAMNRKDFDTLLIPLSCIDWWHNSFEKIALPVANRNRVGVVAMKVFCSGRLPQGRIVSAENCLRYTLGLPISTCIVGCTSVREIDLVAHVARNLEEMGEKERDALRAKTKPHSPKLEWYKKK